MTAAGLTAYTLLSALACSPGWERSSSKLLHPACTLPAEQLQPQLKHAKRCYRKVCQCLLYLQPWEGAFQLQVAPHMIDVVVRADHIVEVPAAAVVCIVRHVL